jgi:hypothetical protein
MKKKFYKLTWGHGLAQICCGKLETATILFELLAEGQSVKVILIEKPS